jgi:hypothetical protein
MKLNDLRGYGALAVLVLLGAILVRVGRYERLAVVRSGEGYLGRAAIPSECATLEGASAVLQNGVLKVRLACRMRNGVELTPETKYDSAGEGDTPVALKYVLRVGFERREGGMERFADVQ